METKSATRLVFLSDPGKPGVRSLGPNVRPSVRPSITETPFADLTDVTLADEDTKSILTDTVNRAIQGNVAMEVMQPGGKICNLCKCRHLHWCLFCQYLFGIYSVKVISTEKWCLE